MKQKYFVKISILSLFLIVLSFGDVIHQSFSFDFTGVENCDGSFQPFQSFNPSLGTLNSVSMQINGIYSTSVKQQRNSSLVDLSTGIVTYYDTYYGQESNFNIVSNSPNLGLSLSTPVDLKTYGFTAGHAGDLATTALSYQMAFDLTNTSGLTSFSATELSGAPLSITQQPSTISKPSNFISSQINNIDMRMLIDSRAGYHWGLFGDHKIVGSSNIGTISLTYNYLPVSGPLPDPNTIPEPTCVLLVLIGGLGLLKVRKQLR